ncbi:FBX43-like protein [Mya arenaria]|uniref:FBX43-like protein n=1 Tax=Mya arenaria TaxID=6604 RepID=A0ABY7F4Z8_MYAAR|nr:FBX43-like protein [Mya arenaria]
MDVMMPCLSRPSLSGNMDVMVPGLSGPSLSGNMDVIVPGLSGPSISGNMNFMVPGLSGPSLSANMDVMVQGLSGPSLSGSMNFMVPRLSGPSLSGNINVMVPGLSGPSLSGNMDVMMPCLSRPSLSGNMDVMVPGLSGPSLSGNMDVIVPGLSGPSISGNMNFMVPGLSGPSLSGNINVMVPGLSGPSLSGNMDVMMPCLSGPSLSGNMNFIVPGLSGPSLSGNINVMVPGLSGPSLSGNMDVMMPCLSGPSLSGNMNFMVPGLSGPSLSGNINVMVPGLSGPSLSGNMDVMMPCLSGPSLSGNMNFIVPGLSGPSLSGNINVMVPGLSGPSLSGNMDVMLSYQPFTNAFIEWNTSKMGMRPMQLEVQTNMAPPAGKRARVLLKGNVWSSYRPLTLSRGLQWNSTYLFWKSERLHLPKDLEKKRSFSTSTPFIGQHVSHKNRALSISIGLSMQDDSGLGSSLTEISVTNPMDSAKPTVTFTVCKTPTSSVNSPFHLNNTIQSSASPKSSKRFSSRRSLESYFSFDEAETSSASCNDTLNSSQSRISRSFDCSFVRKLDLDLDIYDNQKESQSSSSPLLSSSLPNESHILKNFEAVLQKFSPSEPDRLIGRKMGRNHVDILSQLDQLNISCVSTILSYLDPQDLCSISQVSTDWKRVVESDSMANSRRRRFLQQHRARLQEQGKAASQLKNEEKLQKCPKCRKPAKCLPVQDRGYCQSPDCGYDFCTKCSYDFHGSKGCVPIVSKKTKSSTIGTKKSKKNLKRL